LAVVTRRIRAAAVPEELIFLARTQDRIRTKHRPDRRVGIKSVLCLVAAAALIDADNLSVALRP